MRLEDLLGMLKGVKGSGDQYVARCPAHNDRRASLSVARGNNGGIVLKCMAGCDTEKVVQSLGLTMADLFPDKGTDQASKPKQQPTQEKKKVPAPELKVGDMYTYKDKDGAQHSEKIIKEYVYTSYTGIPVVKVFRTEGKSFPVIHRDGTTWYWGEGRCGRILYRLPEVMKAIKEGKPVHIVEGEKDADTLADHGYCATTNRGGAGKWPSELTNDLKGADVVILPDNDEPGRKHAQLIANLLPAEARSVKIVDLAKGFPQLPEKGDVTDMRQAMTEDDFRKLFDRLVLEAEYTYRRIDDSEYAQYYARVAGYCVDNGCICVNGRKYNPPLCNFVALPTEEYTRDNGVTQDKELSVIGWDCRGKPLPALRVPITEFAAMGWALKGWGMAANIEPGQAVTGKLRQAIQAAGDLHAVKKTIFTHTGWRRIGNKYAFLHAGGAIGAESINVEMEPGLQYYDLTGICGGFGMEMEEGERKRYALLSTLRLMGFVGMRIGAPITGFMFLSPLRHFLEMAGCAPGFIPFLWGRSGSAKTTATSLILCHFGRAFSDKNVPSSFQDTANHIRKKAFLLKDLPLLVDDYHPNTNLQDKRKMEGLAQMLSRTWGDGAERGRMKADTTLQEQMPPRGLGLETGEDLPNIGESGIARLYVIAVRKGEIPINDTLTEMQHLARDGVFSEGMRGYISWLAGQAAELPGLLGKRFEELRTEAGKRMAGAHKRLPSAVAHLMLGLEMMCRYMVAEGAMEEADVPDAMEMFWTATLDNSREQSNDMREERPTKVFLDALRELIQTKRYRVMDLDATETAEPMNMLGYMDKDYYFLNPGLTYAAVQKLCVEQGLLFPIGKNTLFRLMKDENMLMPDTSGKSVRQLCRNKGTVRGWFLWVPRYVLDGGAPPVKQMTVNDFQVVKDDPDNPFTKEVQQP